MLANLDRSVLRRALAYGRRLAGGIRALPASCGRSPRLDPRASPGSGLRAGLGRGQGNLLEALLRYGGDAVATVPPLILLLSEPADLPAEAVRQRLAQARIGLALELDRLPEEALPEGVERILLPARVVLGAADATRALLASGRQVIATGVADLATLERLAKLGVRLVEGRSSARPGRSTDTGFGRRMWGR
jgi:hypothetical protein